MKCSDTVFLAVKKYQRWKKMGINFRELKSTIFRENKLSRIVQNRIFCGIKLSRICQNSRKSRKFLPHYFLPLKYTVYICSLIFCLFMSTTLRLCNPLKNKNKLNSFILFSMIPWGTINRPTATNRKKNVKNGSFDEIIGGLAAPRTL